MIVAVAAMAFTSVETPSATAFATQYQFNGDSMSEVYDTNEWSTVVNSGPGCEEGGLPCVIEVESGSLADWLNARSEQEILDEALTRKH